MIFYGSRVARGFQISDFKASEYVYNVLHRSTDRDKQRKVGSSDLSDPCTYCLAEKMLGIAPPDSPWDMGEVIGTAIHAYLEERNLDAHALKEQHVTIGKIPGYGTVGSTTDLFLERVDNGRVVDFKTTDLSKLKFIKRAWQDEPSDYDLSSVVSARAKINRYLNQVHLYALGVQNMGYEVHGLSLAFIPRDGKQLKRDLWSIDIDYDPERACKVWDRSVRLWQWLEAGNDYHQLPQHEGCLVCQQLRPLQGVDEIEL